MSAFSLVLTIIQVVLAVMLTCIVLFQSGKSAGLSGAIAGVADSFMSKGKGHSWDAKLARATKWVAGLFIVLTFVLSLL